MWGQGFAVYHTQGQFGIIPTRVGTRLLLCLLERFYRDHPHACGDKYATAASQQEILGSSPRVWGQVHQILLIHRLLGIIPTRVGTSYL